MNQNLLFLIFATCLFTISVITITIAPIISKAHISFFDGWGTTNCEKLVDDLDFEKSIGTFDEYKRALKIRERQIDECKRHKIYYSLEYSAFIIDVSLGFIIAIIALIHYVEPGNNFKNITGILGLSIGIISAVITCVYLGYSGYIFNNETIRTIPRLYENKATWKWNGQKYVANYDETSSDYDEGFIKIKDLGKKQYNYDTDIYKASKDTKSEFNGCKSAVVPYTRIDYQGTKHCDYIWINDVQNDSVTNKFLYDRWVTTLLFSAIICVCGIGLCIFGFLVFNNEVVKEVYDSPHPVPVTSSIGTTVNRLKNGNHENNGNNENPNN